MVFEFARVKNVVYVLLIHRIQLIESRMQMLMRSALFCNSYATPRRGSPLELHTTGRISYVNDVDDKIRLDQCERIRRMRDCPERLGGSRAGIARCGYMELKTETLPSRRKERRTMRTELLRRVPRIH